MRFNRRSVLTAGAALLGTSLLPQAAFATAGTRSIRLYDVNRLEAIEVTYLSNGWYNPDALFQLNVFLRDRRNDEVTEMDPGVIDIVWMIQQSMSCQDAAHIICGYRSPETNAMLAARNGGVAQNSYHVRGQAMDIRIPERDLGAVRQVALGLGLGGVGYYPNSDFVHVDTGPVRDW